MFDFWQLPAWLRRATWDWWVVRYLRSRTALSKVSRQVPVLGLADLEKGVLGNKRMRADDRRVEFSYCNDSYFGVISLFALVAVLIPLFFYGIFLMYKTAYEYRYVDNLWDGAGLVEIAIFILLFLILVLCVFMLLCVFVFMIPSLFHLFFRAIGKRRRHAFIFDRERGVVILPPIAFGAYDEVPWESLVIVNFYMPKLYGGSFKVIKAFRPSDLRLITLNEDFPDEAMAFYSWYMDRSKPLPPDEVFDPYRERDEERRLREYGPEVVRQFPASLTGPGTRLVTRMGMAGSR